MGAGGRRAPGLIAGVLSGIAMADPDRAFDLAVALPPPQRGSAVNAVLMRSVQPGQDTAAMAERLLALHDPQLKNMGIQTLLQMWGMHQPQQALDWLLENLERVPPQTVRGVAQLFASQNPTLAAAQLTWISNDARADWFAGVVQGYGETDPHEGASWLGQFRGEPATRTPSRRSRPVAREDGAAARVCSDSRRLEVQVFEEAAMAVLDQWSQQNSCWRQRTGWRASRTSRCERWRCRCSSECGPPTISPARDWVLGLPSGLERDAALTRMSLLGKCRRGGRPRHDGRLQRRHGAPTSDLAHRYPGREDGSGACARFARAIPPDPAQRERVEKLLQSIQTEPPSMPSPGRDPREDAAARRRSTPRVAGEPPSPATHSRFRAALLVRRDVLEQVDCE